jgi:hypothetical protein
MKNKGIPAYTMTSALIALVAYNLLVFVLSQVRTDVFWLSYSFTVFALAIQLVLPLLLRSNGHIKRDAFLKLPAYMHCMLFSAVQFISGIILMLVTVSFKTALLIEIVILSFFLMNTIYALAGKEIIQVAEDSMKQRTSFIHTLTMDVETVREKADDVSLRKKLKELEDAVRYSDPVSNRALETIEQKIQAAMTNLSNQIDRSSIKDAIAEADNMILLFNERNRKCKSLKG